MPKLAPDTPTDFIRAELDKVALAHNTFSDNALGLIVRSSKGVLRRVKSLCLGKLERRRGVRRREQDRQRTNENAQPPQRGQAQQGLERGQHVFEFSCLLQLKRKGYSVGPRCRRAPQTDSTTSSAPLMPK